MGGTKKNLIGKAGDDGGDVRGEMVCDNSVGRDILQREELAYQTLVIFGLFGKMPRMRLMMGTGLTGNVRMGFFVVMMERREKDHRQDDR